MALPSRTTHARVGLAAGLAVVALAATACSSASSPPSKASTTAPASATPTANPEDAAVLATLNGLIKDETGMFDDATPDNTIYNYAAGAAVTYLLSHVESLRTAGVEFTGAPVLRAVQTPVISDQTTPPSATVNACLDETHWTTVYITDPSKSAEAPGTVPTSRPLTVQLQKQSAGWRVTEYSVNGNATC